MENTTLQIGHIYTIIETETRQSPDGQYYTICKTRSGQVVPIAKLTDDRALFVTLERHPSPYVIANYVIPPASHNDIILRAQEDYCTLQSAIARLHMLREGSRQADLYYYCPECNHRWQYTDALTRIYEETVYDELPCPECGSVSGGVYEMRIEDFNIPLYHGPLT